LKSGAITPSEKGVKKIHRTQA